jgi:hypothetical protein
MQHLKIKLLLLYVGIISLTSFSLVPTIDQNILAQDTSTMLGYASQMGSYLDKLGQVMTAAEQIQTLKSLNQLEVTGNAICELCTNSDQQQLTNYIDQVNTDLCSQFSFALKNIAGINKSVQSIEEVINLFQSNPKAAGIALQKAAMTIQTTTQNTLAQMQMLMAQQAQKSLAEEKLEKQTTDAVYLGFHNSDL